MESDKTLFRVSEAAAFLALSCGMVRKLITQGDLPVVRLGRATRLHISDLQNYVATRRFKGEVRVSA